uniref:GOLD domain-containing protein n=1 Tax=Ditylum brightwellii TaxID=49249 RepID=A0A7S4SWC0_9STRA|mmetsp:Transcript_34506/g.46235  ORF Transcript_34506/g.46235 Transcript_34506/m.46235 type:complete len:338 (-) Transcript_34506:377-1390(-)
MKMSEEEEEDVKSEVAPEAEEEDESNSTTKPPPQSEPVPADDDSANKAVKTVAEEEADEDAGETPAPAESSQAELEAVAIAKATASADASYVPSPSLLQSPSPHPLIAQVDGPSLETYAGTESVYMARAVPVPLRGKLDVPIHITTGGSVVEYTIETADYDISFGITAEREEGITIVKENGRVESHTHPISGKFLVGSVPCALVFSFDNEYSWFREKQVTYKVVVMPPTVENICAGRRRRARSALKTVTEDKMSAETRLSRAVAQRTGLAAEISRMEKELAEKKKSLDVVAKEEGWLKNRVELRLTQENILNGRLTKGWPDEEDYNGEKEEENENTN